MTALKTISILDLDQVSAMTHLNAAYEKASPELRVLSASCEALMQKAGRYSHVEWAQEKIRCDSNNLSQAVARKQEEITRVQKKGLLHPHGLRTLGIKDGVWAIPCVVGGATLAFCGEVFWGYKAISIGLEHVALGGACIGATNIAAEKAGISVKKIAESEYTAWANQEADRMVICDLAKRVEELKKKVSINLVPVFEEKKDRIIVVKQR